MYITRESKRESEMELKRSQSLYCLVNPNPIYPDLCMASTAHNTTPCRVRVRVGVRVKAGP